MTAVQRLYNRSMQKMDKTRINVRLPKYMVDALRRRSEELAGRTVTDQITKAIALEMLLFEDPACDVILRNRDTGEEKVLKLL